MEVNLKCLCTTCILFQLCGHRYANLMKPPLPKINNDAYYSHYSFDTYYSKIIPSIRNLSGPTRKSVEDILCDFIILRKCHVKRTMCVFVNSTLIKVWCCPLENSQLPMAVAE